MKYEEGVSDHLVHAFCFIQNWFKDAAWSKFAHILSAVDYHWHSVYVQGVAVSSAHSCGCKFASD